VYFLTVAKDTSNLITISKMIYESMNNLEINNKSTKKILNALKKEVKRNLIKMILHGKRFMDISELKDGITENLNKKYKDGDKIFYTIWWLVRRVSDFATNALKDNIPKRILSIWVQKDLVSYLLKNFQENPKDQKVTGYTGSEDSFTKRWKRYFSNAKDYQI